MKLKVEGLILDGSGVLCLAGLYNLGVDYFCRVCSIMVGSVLVRSHGGFPR